MKFLYCITHSNNPCSQKDKNKMNALFCHIFQLSLSSFRLPLKLLVLLHESENLFTTSERLSEKLHLNIDNQIQLKYFKF